MDTAVQVVQTIWNVYNEVQDGQEKLGGVTRRLDDLLKQFQRMQERDTLVQTDLLDKYLVLSNRFLKMLRKYQERNFLTKVLRQRSMIEEVDKFNAELEVLFQQFHLAMGSHVVEHNRVQDAKMDSMMESMRQLLQGGNNDFQPHRPTTHRAAHDGPISSSDRVAVAERDVDWATLIELLQVGTEDEQCRAAEALNVLSEDEDNHDLLLGSSAVTALVDRLPTATPAVRRAIVTTLYGLTYVYGVDGILLGSGGLERLAGLLQCEHEPQLQADAAGALMNLAYRPENKAVVAGAGVIPSLIRLVRDGADIVKANAADALRELAEDEDCRTEIAKDGGVEILAKLIHTGDSEQCRAAVGALWNLSADPEIKKRIAAVGGIEALVEQVRNGSSDEQKQRAASALTVLAQDDQNDVRIGNAGGIEALVALLRNGTPQQKRSAVWALSELTDNDDNKQRTVNAQGINVLVAALLSEDPLQRDKAARTLWYIAQVPEYRTKIAAVRGIEALVASLNKGNWHASSGALHMLAKEEDLVLALLQADAVSALAGIVARTQGDWILEQALGALKEIAEAGGDALYLVAEHVSSEEVLAIVTTTEDGDVREHALRLLGELSKYTNVAQQIIESNGIGVAACVLASEVASQSEHDVVIFLLGWLAKCPEAASEIQEHDIIPLVVQYMEKAPAGARGNVALFLWNATAEAEELRPLVTCAGGVELLVAMLGEDNDDEDELLAATGALAYVLDVDDDGATRAVKAGRAAAELAAARAQQRGHCDGHDGRHRGAGERDGRCVGHRRVGARAGHHRAPQDESRRYAQDRGGRGQGADRGR
ncbi:hypothetical protein PINS_up006860 [Pythium insidiosum]|nr:hypothetical protein PINS_up006860 [Pythium insidiosum]